MQPKELMILFMAGATLIAVGLVPSLLDALQDGIQNFSATLSPFPRKFQRIDRDRHPVRHWLAAIGLGLIVAGLLGMSK